MKKYIVLPLKNVYRIVGDDYYLIDCVLSELKEACGGEMSDLNQSYFDDENFSADKLIDSCNQMPFIAEKRLVFVRELSKVSEQDKQKILNYAKNSSPFSVLAIIDNNKNFVSIQGALIDCKTLSFLELSKLIQEKFAEHSTSINSDAVKLLIENSSYNLTKITSEIEKLCAYSAGKEITREDVENLVSKSDDYTIFELSDALSKKQPERAIKILELMLETLEPSMILSLLAGHFRRLFHAKISSLSNQELSKLLGVKEFAIVKAKEQSANFTAVNLKKIVELILNTEYMIKSGQMNAENAVHFLVFSILELK